MLGNYTLLAQHAINSGAEGEGDERTKQQLRNAEENALSQRWCLLRELCECVFVYIFSILTFQKACFI